jgi:hypothetical protein
MEPSKYISSRYLLAIVRPGMDVKYLWKGDIDTVDSTHWDEVRELR